MHDAFGILMKNNSEGKVSQYEFRQAMLGIGLKPDRVSMDRVYLFFQRFNITRDDCLKFSEFCEAISPVNERMSFKLKSRQVRNFASKNPHIFEQDIID